MTQRKLFGTTHFVRPCDNLVYFIHSLFFYFTASIMSHISSTLDKRRGGFSEIADLHFHALHFRVAHLLCSREQMSFFLDCVQTPNHS